MTAKIHLRAALITFAFLATGCFASDGGYSQQTLKTIEFEACGITPEKHDQLLALPQDKFDQDFEGGWRPYGQIKSCENAAAELIKDYILYSKPYPSRDVGMLRWHAGQMKAYAGRYDEAVKLFEGTYHTPDDIQDWNFYVDATIGFLSNEKDVVSLAYNDLKKIEVSDATKAMRQKFLDDNPKISMPAGFIDEPGNLSVIKNLLDCFGQPYSVAYSGCQAKDDTGTE